MAVGLATVALCGEVRAMDYFIDTDTRLVNGGTTLNGASFTTRVVGSAVEFLFADDLVLNPGDGVYATGYSSAVLYTAGNAFIGAGVTVGASGIGRVAGAGGGNGGSPSTPPGATPSTNAGGAGALFPGLPGVGFFQPGRPGSPGSPGSAGNDGIAGSVGGAGSAGVSASNGGLAGAGGAAGASGPGGLAGGPGRLGQVPVSEAFRLLPAPIFAAIAETACGTDPKQPCRGGNGGGGSPGLSGGAGGSGLPGRAGSNVASGLVLTGGGGGGAGGSGGSGGSGGAGGGGGSGGGGASGYEFTGGPGGPGGRGGAGTTGGAGGYGGAGGGGGGAVEIRANGRITVFSAWLEAQGGSGASGLRGDGGGIQTSFPQQGAPGGSIGSNPPYLGFPGGNGGYGGAGGGGGGGGVGGSGGGGSGGTVMLRGTAVVVDRLGVNTLGGEGGPGSERGGNGRFIVASNTEVDLSTTTLLGTVPEVYGGMKGSNPLIIGADETPFLLNLQGGADIYGVMDSFDARSTEVQSLLGPVLAGAQTAVIRLESGSGTFSDAMAGYDLLLMLNVSGLTVRDPMLGIVGTAAKDTFVSPLLIRGVNRNPIFGGTGPANIGGLGPYSIYATMIPKATAKLNIGYDGGMQSRIDLDIGRPVYLGRSAELLDDPNVYIGFATAETFIQPADSTSILLGDIYAGSSATGSGTYMMSGGVLASVNVYLGYYGMGAFVQSGGIHSLAGDLYLGAKEGSTGTYLLSGGMLSTTNSFIGRAGVGNFTQTGGAHVVTDTLFIADGESADSSYTLRGGTLTAGAIVGRPGWSTLNLDGGTLVVGGGNGRIDVHGLVFGSTADSNGTHVLSGTGTIKTAQTRVGSRGQGTLVQSGGTLSSDYPLILGEYGGSGGTYLLRGGELTAGGEYVGMDGTGTFMQTGGKHTVTGKLYLGVSPGASGTYRVSAGDLATVGTVVGFEGDGTFIQAGGRHAVAGDLALGDFAGPGGTYKLSGGELSSINTYVGKASGGVFTQTGGEHRVSGHLAIGDQTAISGAYVLSGGNLASGQATKVGVAGTGTFTQTAGTHSTGVMYLGYESGGIGSYTLSGAGELRATDAYGLVVGRFGEGSFKQEGGANRLSGYLALAYYEGSRGSYTLSAGDLSAEGLIVGNRGLATFAQTGGNNVSGYVLIGNGGGDSEGTYLQTGGKHTVQGDLVLARDRGSRGLYNLQGGELSTVNTKISGSSEGAFSQSGGTHTVSKELHVGSDSAWGTYSVYGGTLSAAKIINSGYMGYFGGTLNGNVRNTETFQLGGSGKRVVNGSFENGGTVEVLNTDVEFVGTYTESGALRTDHSNLSFSDVKVTPGGRWFGAAGDTFSVSGDFENLSEEFSWNTAHSTLRFDGGHTQNLYLAGFDAGARPLGYIDNFAWGRLEIADGSLVVLHDGNDVSGGALYLGELVGADINGKVVTNITNVDKNRFDLYYNPALGANAYLGGQSYVLSGGGQLRPVTVPVPEPATYVMLLAGLGLLGLATQRGARRSGLA